MQETFTLSQMSVTQGFGERLAQERREKAARDRRDISQKDVALAIGSSEPSVSRWESGLGVPHDPTLQKLADYFGVTLGWLRYGQEPRVPLATGTVSGAEPYYGEPRGALSRQRQAPAKKAAGGKKRRG
jgi:transcriptional regulator with XRE-family HTH domain